jgi:hypothetical protein
MVHVRIWFTTPTGERKSMEARVKFLSGLVREIGWASVQVIADPAPEPDLRNLGRYWSDGHYVGEKGA